MRILILCTGNSCRSQIAAAWLSHFDSTLEVVSAGTQPSDKISELAVTPGSPADKAGLTENDIILEINGQKITKDNSLSSLIRQYKPGDEITLKVLKKGEEKEIKVILAEYS